MLGTPNIKNPNYEGGTAHGDPSSGAPARLYEVRQPYGRKHGRKRSKRDSEAAPQLTVNVLLLPSRHQPSAPVLTEADGATIIDITNSEED